MVISTCNNINAKVADSIGNSDINRIKTCESSTYAGDFAEVSGVSFVLL